MSRRIGLKTEPSILGLELDLLKQFSDGTLTADGTEQTVVELTRLGHLEGYIDLSNMQAGDTLVIKVYVKIKSGGSYRQYDSGSYSGVQTSPALHVSALPASYGVKVTLQQSAGINRDYDYKFYRRE